MPPSRLLTAAQNIPDNARSAAVTCFRSFPEAGLFRQAGDGLADRCLPQGCRNSPPTALSDFDPAHPSLTIGHSCIPPGRLIAIAAIKVVAAGQPQAGFLSDPQQHKQPRKRQTDPVGMTRLLPPRQCP